MILIGQIISKLRPDYEYVVVGNTYDGIDWKGNDPIPYEEFLEAYENYEEAFQEKGKNKEIKKEMALQKLSELGITPEDIRLVLE
jgi:hypothetical protein